MECIKHGILISLHQLGSRVWLHIVSLMTRQSYMYRKDGNRFFLWLPYLFDVDVRVNALGFSINVMSRSTCPTTSVLKVPPGIADRLKFQADETPLSVVTNAEIHQMQPIPSAWFVSVLSRPPPCDIHQLNKEKSEWCRLRAQESAQIKSKGSPYLFVFYFVYRLVGPLG